MVLEVLSQCVMKKWCYFFIFSDTMEMENLEPPEKKAKKVNDIDEFILKVTSPENNLKAVVSDEYHHSIPLIKVYAGYVKDQKTLSNTITVLNRNVPLKELQHLKRVHKSCILLCPVNYLNTITQESIQDFIEHHVPELKDVFDYFKDIEVPLYSPKTKKQYSESNRKWACNFHPDKYIEKLLSDSFFKKDELETHRRYMGMAFEIAKWYLAKKSDYTTLRMQDLLSPDINAAVVVDPSIESVVAVAFDYRLSHPLQHTVMLAIDNVAKTQNGGVWTTESDTDNQIRGFNEDILLHLKDIFRHTRFGSKKYLTKEEIADSSKLSENPYLCTGYNIYLLREPCVMCSMGLVHARMKRIFFCIDNPIQGALKSNTKLQCNSSLNHRFEVFTGFYP